MLNLNLNLVYNILNINKYSNNNIILCSERSFDSTETKGWKLTMQTSVGCSMLDFFRRGFMYEHIWNHADQSTETGWKARPAQKWSDGVLSWDWKAGVPVQ